MVGLVAGLGIVGFRYLGTGNGSKLSAASGAQQQIEPTVTTTPVARHAAKKLCTSRLAAVTGAPHVGASDEV